MLYLTIRDPFVLACEADVELELELRALFNSSHEVKLSDLVQAHWDWQKREHKREHGE